MSDVYADTRAANSATLELLINGMEVRAADPRQVAIRQLLFVAADFPPMARVLEVGCGSGAICRHLAQRPEVTAVTGVDPSPVFLAQGPRACRRAPKRSIR